MLDVAEAAEVLWPQRQLAMVWRTAGRNRRAQLEAIERGAGGPVETIMLAGCDHAPHGEQPEIVLAAMARFIGGIHPSPHP